MTAIRYGNLHVQLLVQHGTRLDRVELETPAPRLRVSGLGQAALASGAPLVGRGELLDRLAGLARPGWAVELRAACGFGKSSLLAALAARLAASTAAPAVHLRVGAVPPDDVLDQLVGALFIADQPVRPTPQQRAGLLGNVRAVVVLDDVTLESQQLAEIASALPQCLVLIGSDSDQPVLDAGGVSVALPGLAEPAGLQLLVRDLGRPLGQDEADGAARLCAAVRGQPLRLRQAAALAATGQHTLQRLADRAERDPAALDRLSVHALAQTERRVLAVLALAAGAVLPGELVEVVSGVDDLAAQLDKLRRQGLVEQDHDRFGLPRCLGAGYRKLLVANLDIGAAVRPLTTWLAQRDPGSADALAAASAAVQLVGRLAERGDWPELARLAEVTARVLTLAGRWDLCRQVLLQGLHAAQQLGDLAAQARFAHDLGSMALCNDQLQQAEELLNQALALREQLGDHEGAALTRHNLEIMTPPAPPVPHRPSQAAGGSAGASGCPRSPPCWDSLSSCWCWACASSCTRSPRPRPPARPRHRPSRPPSEPRRPPRTSATVGPASPRPAPSSSPRPRSAPQPPGRSRSAASALANCVWAASSSAGTAPTSPSTTTAAITPWSPASRASPP